LAQKHQPPEMAVSAVDKLWITRLAPA